MLSRDMRQNLASVVAIAKKFSDFIGAENLINLFQDFKSFEGLYHFLGHIVNCSQLPSVHLKYIEAAAKMQQFKEVFEKFNGYVVIVLFMIPLKLKHYY